MQNKKFYLAIDYDNKDFVAYCSEKYIIKEDEILILIRMLLKERRNIKLGNKILNVYKDVYKENPRICEEKLKKICVHYENEKPTIREKKHIR